MIQNARTLKETNIPELGDLNRGKVRDNYYQYKNIIMIATDRISCFDHVLSRQIPYKGQVLTSIMKHQADNISDIIPHHAFDMPDPQVLVVKNCKPYDVEVVIRGYITGSLWRDYKKDPEQAGVQYGILLPSGLKENEQLDIPIVTPTTRAKIDPKNKELHHDEPVSREEIINPILLRDIDGVGKKGEKNLFYIKEGNYDNIVRRAIQVFKRGQEIALQKNLLLVDTKYEFGDLDGVLYLIDEVHTPDSSRFWHADTYKTLFEKGEKQKSLSKEYVREWLIAQGYDKNVGESSLTDLTNEVVEETALRYIGLCETLIGEEFVPGDMSRPLEERILENLRKKEYYHN